MDDSFDDFAATVLRPIPAPSPPPPEHDDGLDDILALFDGTPSIQDAPPVDMTGEDLSTFSPAPEFEAAIERNLVRELLRRGPFPLLSIRKAPFQGQGVYALYYQGSLSVYAPLRSPGSFCPMYVGKSVQRGRRKGACDEEPQALFQRLVTHARSIDKAVNLDVSDFTFRFVVLPKRWVSFAEHVLIEFFQPLWNVCLDGFGNHAVGSTRQDSQLCTEWDTFHPGRDGAATRPRDHLEVEAKLHQWLPYCVRAFQSVNERLDQPNPA